jgi:uncharacterized protein (DUF433 family)
MITGVAMASANINPVTLMSPGHWRVAATRVSLDSVVIAYWNGESSRTIVENYPSLNVEQVEAAIAWYLANREAVDAGMIETEKKWRELEAKSAADQSPLMQRMRERMRARADAVP